MRLNFNGKVITFCDDEGDIRVDASYWISWKNFKKAEYVMNIDKVPKIDSQEKLDKLVKLGIVSTVRSLERE